MRRSRPKFTCAQRWVILVGLLVLVLGLGNLGRAGVALRYSALLPDLPMTITVRMAEASDAEAAAARPGVRRVDEHTVEAVVERHCDVVKWINDTGLP